MNGTGPLMSLVPVSYQRNHRGFTGHEHLDEWGLVNMNGRIYNPDLGRFLSADPYVQFPQSTQGLDRYAYVQNNPLSATDPSGHGILGILGSIVSFFLPPLGQAMIAVDGFLEGGLRGMVMSALSMYAAGQVGNAFGDVGGLGREALRAAVHGLAQGTISAAFGGKFGPAFLSASFSSAAGSYSPRFGGGGARGAVLRVIRGAIVGGTASAIGGGKFANGATTAAFVQAFNHERPHAAATSSLANAGDATGEIAAGELAATGRRILAGLRAIGARLGIIGAAKVLTPNYGDEAFLNHYTTAARAELIREGGYIQPGEDGNVYVTPDVYTSAIDAQANLSLRTTPDGYFRVPMENIPVIERMGPVRAIPADPGGRWASQPGGGWEVVVPGKVSIGDPQWVPIGP